jgi:hypothetical protein
LFGISIEEVFPHSTTFEIRFASYVKYYETQTMYLLRVTLASRGGLRSKGLCDGSKGPCDTPYKIIL